MYINDKYLYKKVINSDNKEDFIYTIGHIKNVNLLADTIYFYVSTTNYPLEDILDISNPKMEDALNKVVYRFIPLDFYRLTKEDIKILVNKRYFDVIDSLERCLNIKGLTKILYDVVITSKIYTLSVLSSFYQANLLHKLYSVIKEPEVLKVILIHGVNIYHMNDFRNMLKEEEKIEFLNNLIENTLLTNYNDPSKINMDEYFDSFEIDYICKKMLEDEKMNNEYALFFINRIYNNKLNKEYENMLFNKIIESKNAKYIYLTLVNCNSENSIKLLEGALKETRNFEYNFYYNLKKNKELIIKAFGGYLALKLFIENNSAFKDKMEAKKMLEHISDVNMQQIESKWETDLLNIMFSDSDVDVKDNDIAKKMGSMN